MSVREREILTNSRSSRKVSQSSDYEADNWKDEMEQVGNEKTSVHGAYL